MSILMVGHSVLAGAADGRDRTVVSCRYSGHWKVTSVQRPPNCEGGDAIKVCDGEVVCTDIDNEALRKEFGGDRNKARDASLELYNGNPPTRYGLGSVVSWAIGSKPSEPKFLSFSSRASCTANAKGLCPVSAEECYKNRVVIDVKQAKYEDFDHNDQYTNTGEARRGSVVQ